MNEKCIVIFVYCNCMLINKNDVPEKCKWFII